MLSTALGATIIYRAEIILIKINAPSFNYQIPPVIPDEDPDGVILKFPFQLVNLVAGLRFFNGHHQIMATQGRATIALRQRALSGCTYAA